ncbi:MAG: tyrosine--tRNA ligase [Phycisphaeraceae bacterium]|nr:tyrosine--tRNA ligase [Phycisphaeraceae bacterium]
MTSAAPAQPFLDDLRARGLLHQCTSEAALAAHLADPVIAPRRAYAGFDPTADSLTVGNLLPITLLRRFQLAGHSPVVVMGGATGLIGDPSGKSAERELLTPDRVAANVESQRRIFGRIIDLAPSTKPATAPLLLNNLDWIGRLSFLEALRDVGKHFSVNMMIQKDSVRERLHARDQGISYTEFSYMILQAYDFAHLYKHHHVTLQIGGSDQWGNIVAGIDLIRRGWIRTAQRAAAGSNPDRASEIMQLPVYQEAASSIEIPPEKDAFGLTAPLVTKSDGSKFGKSESGAVWLTPERTSPYAFYQFWLNAADTDVLRLINFYTFFSLEQIQGLAAKHAANPGARDAHRALASHMTALLHGQSEADKAESAAKALFSGDLRSIDPSMLAEALAAAPASTHDKSQLAGDGLALLDLLPQTTICQSKTEARRLLAEGSISVNGDKAAPDTHLTPASLLNNRLIALRRGKKAWHVTVWG